MDLRDWLSQVVGSVQRWQSEYPPFETHPSLRVSDQRFADAFGKFAERMRGNYPYFHPLYAGQMLKPPHPVARLAYEALLAALQAGKSLEDWSVLAEYVTVQSERYPSPGSRLPG